ncbi:MAG: hypothetical protein HZB68_05120 [Candidatus Aenigmarchaeota archaeon]|nr:hypothetical protein [Candidatus Aenigmarchaeota archaeon]
MKNRKKLIVCGSIGYGGIEDIEGMYTKLGDEGFEILNHIRGKDMDYSAIRDFRDEDELCQRIVNHDLEYVDKADVLVVIFNGPSYGTAMEMYYAKQKGKKIVLLAEKEIATPWPVHFSDYVVKSQDELFRVLRDLEKEE